MQKHPATPIQTQGNRKWLWIAGVVVMVLGTFLFVSSRNKARKLPDPTFYHTPEGMNATLQEQKTLLLDALQKKDLQFIHGQVYYIQGITDSFTQKVEELEAGKKERLRPKLTELKQLALEVDNFSGRNNYQATEVSLKKLFDAMAALDAEFKPQKK